MRARPDYVNLETGEIVDLDLSEGKRSPLGAAMSQLAAFKFKLVETVAADPLLREAPCTDAIVVFMHFVTIDKATLQPTPAYASLVTLMARGGMKRTAAKKARKLLELHRYLVPTGSKTKEGCTKYRLENPRGDIVQMHIQEAAEYWSGKAAENRKEERRKKAADEVKGDVVSDNDTTENGRGVVIQHDVVSKYDTNYLRGYLGGISSREGEPFKTSSAPSYDPHLPYPIPESEQDLTFRLSSLFNGCQLSAEIMEAMHKMLMAGKLTPAIVEEQRRFAYSPNILPLRRRA